MERAFIHDTQKKYHRGGAEDAEKAELFSTLCALCVSAVNLLAEQLGDQEYLADRAAPLEGAVGFRCTGQGNLPVDRELELPLREPAEHVTGARAQLVARCRVVRQAGARQVQRAARVEDVWIER